MPRRRKKAASSQWPPLKFVHSPKNDPTPLLLPDVGVENPVTAKEVPIENMSDISWVSPQFRRTGTVQLDRRKGSALLSRGRNRGTTGREDVSHRKSKLKALEFLTDYKNRSGVTVCSDVDVPTILNSSKQDCDNCDRSCSERRHSDTDSLCVKSKKKGRHKRGHLSVLRENSGSEMQTCSEEKYRLCGEPTGHVPGVEKDVQDRLPEEIDLSFEQMHGTDPSSSRLNFSSDQTRRQDRVGNIQNESDLWSETAENMMNASVISCNTPNLPSSPCDISRTRALYLNLCTTPLRKSDDTSESDILVVDTPESEYDLTLRQRQIKYALISRLAFNND